MGSGHKPEGAKAIGKTYGTFKIAAYNGLRRLNERHSIGIYHIVCMKCGQEYDRPLYYVRKNAGYGCIKCRKTTQTHGDSRTRLYGIWCNMKDRCYRPGNGAYERYGGRGILLCDEWVNDYSSFKSWSISHGYAANLSIDRIDNDMGYGPDNCRWVTSKEQCYNRRSNHLITANGKTQTILQWCKELGVSKSTVYNRLRLGWSEERAVTTPKKGGIDK